MLRLALGDDLRTRELPFDQILDEVVSGRADAGLLIHEGQLTYADAGLHKLLDLGVWWQARRACRCRSASSPRGATSSGSTTSPPCSARRSRPASSTATRRSRTRERSAAASTRETADRFVAMYVNELTLDMGDAGAQRDRRACSARSRSSSRE